jgi:hypothetical protein
LGFNKKEQLLIHRLSIAQGLGLDKEGQAKDVIEKKSFALSIKWQRAVVY